MLSSIVGSCHNALTMSQVYDGTSPFVWSFEATEDRQSIEDGDI